MEVESNHIDPCSNETQKEPPSVENKETSAWDEDQFEAWGDFPEEDKTDHQKEDADNNQTDFGAWEDDNDDTKKQDEAKKLQIQTESNKDDDN